MAICTNCSTENAAEAAFCRSCGSPLTDAPARREQRKVVTVLFCDLVDSTGLATRDSETFRRIQLRYFERMRGIIEQHGGTIEKFIGDEVMAVFGVPLVHEDDALRAVRAAREMLDALSALNDELEPAWRIRLQARIGINTGEVVASDPDQGHGFVAGEAVIVAKRLEQAAEAGEILIGRETYRLVAHAVEAGPLERIPVKGKRDAVGKRRVGEVDLDAPAVARRPHAPLVGRDRELERLQEAFERAVADRSARLFTLLGPAGIGKSRLVGELVSAVEDRARTTVGRCLSYGEGITFWPLADALRGLGGAQAVATALDGDDDRDTILATLRGVTAPADAAVSAEELFWAARRAFESLARDRPLVLCFEDVHWAETTLLDLLEYVIGWSRDAPILIVAAGRPELVERRPHWTAPQHRFEVLALQPLTAAEMDRLLVDLAGERTLDPDLRSRIAAAAEGNPLFLEQMTAMAAEERGGELTVPPSIQALLSERLDRLTGPEREVIERASVVGRDFPVAAIAALVPDERRPAVAGHLFSLLRKGLIRAVSAPSGDEDRFGFQHVLVRDAAYEAMPKELRAVLNERFADWLEALGRGRGLDELVGYHLEQAHDLRVDLGLPQEHTDAIARRAGDLLGAAGVRALGRNDVHAAANLLERAVALAPAGDAAVALRVDLSQALFSSGRLAEAAVLAAAAAERAAAAGDEVGELRARLAGARIAAQTPPDGDLDAPSAELLAVAKRARRVFARLGDELALTEAWFATAWSQLIQCRFAMMLEAVEHALVHARRAGSPRWEGELPVWQGTAKFYGPTHVNDVLRWYEEQPARHPIALTQQAMLEAMRGRFEEARALAAAADATAEEFGQGLWLAAGGMAVWEIETLAGNPAAAERAVRRSCELLEELGDTGYRWMAAGELAASLVALERLDEAQTWTRAAEAQAAADDVIAHMLWRQVRAAVLVRQGDHDAAEGLAREAVALAEETDMLNAHGNALADLAEVYLAAGRPADAREALAQALALYERKGNRVAAAAAAARLDGLAAGAAARAGS